MGILGRIHAAPRGRSGRPSAAAAAAQVGGSESLDRKASEPMSHFAGGPDRRESAGRQEAGEPVRRSRVRRVLRWTGRLFLGFAALLLLAAAGGAVYQTLATRRDARVYPAPGRLVDVGGFRLHMVCSGSAGPSVVMDGPLGASHMVWSQVQPEVARFARVCSFDRAGYGWSEAGPAPRTSGRAVDELHALLANAGVRPPFVLVGNSLGGANARLFAFRYPEEVGGLVLVEPVHEDQLTRLPVSARIQSSEVIALNVFSIASRVGLLRPLGLPLGEGSSNRLPAELRPAAQAAGYRTAWIDATRLEMHGLEESFAEVRAARLSSPDPVHPLRDLPLQVLTRGEKGDGTPDAEESLRVWRELHGELARESLRGEHIVVPESGHFIQVDRPGAVVEAVRKVVEEIRATSGTSAPTGSR